MTPEKILNRSYALQAQVVEEAFALDQAPDLRRAFVYRHGVAILRLAEDLFYLEAERRCYSSSIIIRSMLESLFNLVAAVKNPAFAAEKVCWEVEDEVKRLRKWLTDVDCDFEDTVRTLSELTRSLRREHKLQSPANWNTLACAEAAELGQQYRREYFFFSKNVHATTSGIIAQENEVGRGHRLQTAAFVLLCGAVHLVQLLPTKTAQAHVDQGSQLMEALIDLGVSGKFKNLDSQESE